MRRTRSGVLLLVFVSALAACGDDDVGPGVGLGRGDGGPRDAAADAASDAGPFDANVKPPPYDAGGDAGKKPPKPPDPEPTDDDGGLPKCSVSACSKMADECNQAHCDEETGECVRSARANGTRCGSDVLDNCSAPDTCKAGKCVTNDAPKNTPCGDHDKDCRKDDACDGDGTCVDKGFLAEDTACGNRTTNTPCDRPDSCNDQGECLHNYAAVDAPCGDQNQLCLNNDSCDGLGACIDSGAWTLGQCPMGESGASCVCGSTVVSMCHPSADVCDEGACVFSTSNDPACDD